MSDVALLHGLGSSFDRNWRAFGWVSGLDAAGYRAVPLALPGHGPGPHATDPAAYADTSAAVLRQLDRAGGPVDAVGFSVGAEVLLSVAMRRPGTFRRLVLLGVGEPLLAPAPEVSWTLADEIERGVDGTNGWARLFRRMVAAAGNEMPPILAFLRRPRRPMTPETLAAVTVPVLVVLGDEDPAAPGDRLVAALPDARLVTLPGTDHFTTPADPRAIAAAVEFLSAGRPPLRRVPPAGGADGAPGSRR